MVEVGTGIPLNSESPSHGLTFNPQLTVGAGRAASGRLRRTPAVRDCQGLWSGIRDQGPAPGWARAGASPWSLVHHSQCRFPSLCTSSRMPCAQQAHSCCRSSPAALAVSHCTTTLQPLAVRNSKFRHPSTAAGRLGMFSHSNSARYFCSLQQGESSSSERAEVASALAGAAARSALGRALSARIM